MVRLRDLCEAPFSALDLIELADRFPRRQVTEVPVLATRSPDAQQRFVNLVDVARDRDVELTLRSAHPITDILAGGVVVPDLARTASRLRLLRTGSGTPSPAR